ncbi:unnamed protein product [Vicia faba]|uniref:Uncharacterized protein n=1 Tax=Vicia faba TaxID=3906 RepID=A0AAV0Z7X1_VICFA|nr:unnamed protein product [Vicia faba]
MGVEPNSAKTPDKNKMETGIPLRVKFLAFSLLGLEDWELAITRIGPLVIVKAQSQLSNQKPKPSKGMTDGRESQLTTYLRESLFSWHKESLPFSEKLVLLCKLNKIRHKCVPESLGFSLSLVLEPSTCGSTLTLAKVGESTAMGMGWMSLASLQKGAVLTYQERGKQRESFYLHG